MVTNKDMDKERLKRYYQVYTNAWKLFRLHAEGDWDDESWTDTIRNAGNLARLHEGDEAIYGLAKTIMLDTLDALEREGKRR